jgi:ribosomal-protein-alanine N-acetyltransferase
VRIYLRSPVAADQREFLERSRASRRLHHPWTAPPATPERYRAWVKRMRASEHRAFLVCRKDDEAIAGVINLSNMVMGAFCSGFLGYYAFAGFERQGLMREGLQAVVRHAFRELKLHRLEANIQPANAPSIALVRACGFQLEGYSPKYLKIGGRWRDHERWAVVSG